MGNKKLHLVADASGSMQEMGKAYLLVSLMRSADQLGLVSAERLPQVDLEFWSWGEVVSELSLSAEGWTAVPGAGRADLAVLQAFIEQELAQHGACYCLILSDGHFVGGELKSFEQWRKKQVNLYAEVVAIGADANLVKLAKLGTGKRVYQANHMLVAIRHLLFGGKGRAALPQSIAELLTKSATAAVQDSTAEDWA